MKQNFIWIFWTLCVALLVSIIQMYSRDITIDKVHRTEFNLIYKLFNENKTLSRKEIKSQLEPLLTKKGFALFHIGVISPISCFENTKHYYNRPLFCETFHNFNTLLPYTEINEFNTQNFPSETKHGSYLIKDFSNSDEYLIAKTNFYSQNNELTNFIYFIQNRYYQPNGYRKILEKGQFLFFAIFTVSFLLWLINRAQQNKHFLQYKNLQKNEKELYKKLNQLDNEYNDLKIKRYENDNLIEEFELKIQNTKEISEAQQQLYKEEIHQLQKKQKDLKQQFSDKENLIISMEKENSNLKLKMYKELKKLANDKKEYQDKKMFEKLAKVEQLWRHEPNWHDRKNIESLVALKSSHLPFTITQGFIAFDKLVMKLVKKENEFLDEGKTTLASNIYYIFENNLLPQKYKKDFHSVRKARNEWFHAGIYPKSSVIDFLVTLLNDVEADVFI